MNEVKIMATNPAETVGWVRFAIVFLDQQASFSSRRRLRSSLNDATFE